jgi:hypothetical protein
LETKGADGWKGIWNTSKVMTLCLTVAVEIRKALSEAAEMKIAKIWFRRLRHGERGDCGADEVASMIDVPRLDVRQGSATPDADHP